MKSLGPFAISVDGDAEECPVLISDQDQCSVFDPGATVVKDTTPFLDGKEWADEQYRDAEVDASDLKDRT